MEPHANRAIENRRRLKLLTRAGLALVCALAIVAVAGCGGSSDSSSSSSEGSTEASEPTEKTEETTGTSEESVDLAMVQTVPFTPYDGWVKAGAESAAAAGNAEITIQGPSEANGTNEATMAASLLANEPAGFAPNPCVLPAWERVMKEMTEKVPNENVIAWDCAPISEPGQKSPVPTFVGVKTKEVGRTTAEAIVKQGELDPSTTGTVVLGNCSKGVPSLDERLEGAEEVFAAELPKAKIVSIGSALEQSKNQAAWISALSNEDEVVAAWGTCDQDQESLQRITTKNGGEFAAGGANLNEAQLKATQAGTFAGGVSTEPWSEGYVTTQLMIDGARGQKAPEGFINIGVHEVSKENAAEFMEALQSAKSEEEFYKPIAEEILAEAEKGTNVEPMDALYE